MAHSSPSALRLGALLLGSVASATAMAQPKADPSPHWLATPLPGDVIAGPGAGPRDTCPCTDGTPESDFNCGVPTDTVNGGCNYQPNVFSPIVPGQAVCGTVGTMQVNGTDTRDTDWYRFTLPVASDIHWTVRPEFEARLIILRGDTCGMTEVITTVVPACVSSTLSAQDQPAGTYVVFVAPSVFSGIPCGGAGTSYRGLLTTGPVNDACGNAIDVSAGGTFAGTLVGGTNDASAPCGASSGNPDVWYAFTAPSCGTLVANTCGTHDINGVDTGIDTVLSAHVGCGNAAIACNDDWYVPGCSDDGVHRDSAITVQTTAGEVVMLRVSVFGNGGTPGPFLLNVSFSPSLSNDVCSGAIPLLNGVTPFCTTGATTDGPDLVQCVDTLNNTWYRYYPTCAGRVTINTCTANTFDTVLAVYRTDSCDSLGSATLIACNDDAGCGLVGRGSSVTFTAAQGRYYYVSLGGYSGATGSGNLTVTCTACACDFNADGRLNSQDFFDYLNCFFGASCPIGVNADFNVDSTVNSQDFFDFLACFFSGC